MTIARQAAPQNFGTLRLYADPGLRDAPTWRRGRDSNPRYPCEYAAFRVRCFQPLSHLSGALIYIMFLVKLKRAHAPRVGILP